MSVKHIIPLPLLNNYLLYYYRTWHTAMQLLTLEDVKLLRNVPMLNISTSQGKKKRGNYCPHYNLAVFSFIYVIFRRPLPQWNDHGMREKQKYNSENALAP